MYLSKEGELLMSAAQAAYEAYCRSKCMRSSVSGLPLPPWDKLDSVSRNAWFAAAGTVTVYLASAEGANEDNSVGMKQKLR